MSSPLSRIYWLCHYGLFLLTHCSSLVTNQRNTCRTTDQSQVLLLDTFTPAASFPRSFQLIFVGTKEIQNRVIKGPVGMGETPATSSKVNEAIPATGSKSRSYANVVRQSPIVFISIIKANISRFHQSLLLLDCITFANLSTS